MTDIDILLRAIKTLRPALPALVGGDWAQFEDQLNTYLRQMKTSPERAQMLRAQVLALFGRYPQAHQRLVKLRRELQKNEGDTIRGGDVIGYEAVAIGRGVVEIRVSAGGIGGTVVGAKIGSIASATVHTDANADDLSKAPAPLAEPRYLNAGFFTAGRDDGPVASEQPLSLADAPYRLGVNVGEFWGLGTPDTPIPDDVLKPLFDQHPELILDVAVRSFTVTLPEPYQRLPLAASGNSQMHFFPVEFPDVGRHTIEIDLIYCGHLLQSRRVEAYVVEHTGDPVPQSAGPVQDAYITFTRTAALDPQSLKSLAERPSQLTVVAERSQSYNRIGLRFYRTSAEVEELGFEQSEITDANLVKRLKAVRKQLKATMEAYVGGIGGSEQQLTTQLGKLADIGRSFYCALLPGLSNADRAKDTRRKLLNGLKPGTIIQVAPLSAQLSVPWELLYERPLLSYKEGRTRLCPEFRKHGSEWIDCPHHDDPKVVCPHGFWGYRYIIEQLPCRSERSDPPRLALPMYVRNDLPLKLVALINPTLNNWKTHRQTLTNLAPTSRLRVDQRDTLDTIFAALEQQEADVLYIYAHGGQDDSGRPCLKVANDDLIVEQDLNALRITFYGAQPLIVMNACESASYSPEDFESFILYFCKYGAAGVIGAQCGVTELLVDGMMKLFLAEFLKQTPAGEALYLARRSLLLGDRPDPRGLVYSLFAAADLKVAQAVNP
ncbi:MAG: CHAT domain-containing protein [Chloroflexi bacterium]|nr:CHAT domain-containing protein [Chloroflexota bacterium]